MADTIPMVYYRQKGKQGDPAYGTPFAMAQASSNSDYFLKNNDVLTYDEYINELKNLYPKYAAGWEPTGFTPGMSTYDLYSATNPKALENVSGQPSDYVSVNGVPWQKSVFDKDQALQAQVSAGTMKNIGTTKAPKYIPTGSAGDLLQTNPDEYYRQHPELKPSPTTTPPSTQATLTGTTGPAAPTGVNVNPTGSQTQAGSSGFTSFVRAANDPITVYGVTSGGQYVKIESPDQFTSLGGDWNNIGTVKDIPSSVSYTDYSKSPGAMANSSAPPEGSPWSQADWSSLDANARAVLGFMWSQQQNEILTGQQAAADKAALYENAKIAAANDPDIQAAYGDQLTLAQTNLENNLSYINKEYTQASALTAAQQEKDRKALAESEAQAGRAYSGFREQAKGLLSQQQTGVIESAKRNLQQQVQQQGQTYEQAYGTGALAALGTIGAGGETYQPVGGLTGTVPLQKKTDIYNKGLQIYQQEVLT